MKKEYIVGIDFGHGEIAAWYIPLDDTVKEAKNGLSLKINPANTPSERKIRSVINRLKDGNFSLEEPGRVFVGFKDKVHNITKNTNNEAAYQAFIKEIYKRVLTNNSQLINTGNGETNFYLCIACPTKWKSKDKEDYIIFFEKALNEYKQDIHWIINESDAAYFTHKDDQKIVLVIDFGSSTIDYTLIDNGKKVSDDDWSNAQLGARAIEKSMLEAFLRDSKFLELLHKTEALLEITGNNHIDVLSQLELEFRKVKESGFTGFKNTPYKPFDYQLKFDFYNITSVDKFEELEFKHKGFFYGKNGVCEDYITRVEADFRKLNEKIRQTIGGKPIDKIILSGGACIMKWVREKAQEVFQVEEITDDPNPEYVVAQGIALYAKAQQKALQQLIQKLRMLDYVSMYKIADSVATQIATKKMFPTVINVLKGDVNYTGNAMVQEFCRFFHGLNSQNNEYCKIMKECMNNLLSEKIGEAVGDTIKTVFNCAIDTSDIRVTIPIVVPDWSTEMFFSSEGKGFHDIYTAINNASGRFSFTWDKARMYDERKKIVDSCFSTFSTRDPFGPITYNEERIKKISVNICDATLEEARKVFHEKELFKTTFKRS